MMKPIEPLTKRNFTATDILGSLIFTIAVFQICMPVTLLALCPPADLVRVFLIGFAGAALASALCFLYHQIHYRVEKGVLEREKQEAQLRQSKRLLAATASLNREFRNMLSVISLMADSAKGEAIQDQILSLAGEINCLFFTGVMNPVVASVILAHNILAREKGITILVNANTTLHLCTANPDLLEQILDRCLELFVENEIAARSFARLICVDITETEEEYIFNFCNSEEAILTFKSCRLLTFKKPVSLEFRWEGAEKFKPVARLIAKLGAMHELRTYGGFAGELNIWIKKKD
jgi:hypothetical protein